LSSATRLLQDHKTELGLEEAEFLISDLAAKLEYVFVGPKKRVGFAAAAENEQVDPAIIHSGLSLLRTTDIAKTISSVVGSLAGYLKVRESLTAEIRVWSVFFSVATIPKRDFVSRSKNHRL
jgi:hypothetical protein